MTRDERLVFCKTCQNRKSDFQKGLLCGLTNEFADFEAECLEFDLDHEEHSRLLSVDLQAIGEPEKGDPLNASANKRNGAIITICGLIAFCTGFIASYNYSGMFWGVIAYGIAIYFKGVAQQREIDKAIAFKRMNTGEKVKSKEEFDLPN